MSKGNPLIAMRLDPATIARLDCLAAASGVTRGQLVQRALQLLPEWARVAVPAPQLPGQIALVGVDEAQK